jgi:hypothetical protein
MKAAAGSPQRAVFHKRGQGGGPWLKQSARSKETLIGANGEPEGANVSPKASTTHRRQRGGQMSRDLIVS